MATQIDKETTATVPIRQFGDPVLRMQAEEVDPATIMSPGVQGIIDNMVASLRAAGGVGLAAPQIGVSQRIIIIEIGAMTRTGYGPVPETPLIVLVNPRIISASEELRRAPEACLSIHTPDGAGVYEGTLERPERVVVQGFDRAGDEITVEGDKLLSRALQHEVDHLDGMLFTDRIQELKDLRIYYPVDAADPVFERNARFGKREDTPTL